MVRQILNRLWQVGGGELTHPGDAAAYLVQFGNTAALVDAGTGYGHEQLKKNISQCLSPDARLEYLLLTHCHFDHTGGAADVSEDFGCQIVAHAEDARFLEKGDSTATAASWYGARFSPLAIDVKLEDEETLLPIGDGSITAIHWPGHSPGSVIYTTIIEQQKVVFAQDVHGPIHPAFYSDEIQYQASLEKLLMLASDVLLEGHYGVFFGKRNVKEFIQSFMILK